MPHAAGPALPNGRTVDVRGRGRMFVREIEGPPGAPVVVLLHGWTATADLNWFTSYDALGRHFRVVAVDHRGHGRGIRSWRPFRLQDCADDVAALLVTLGVEQAIVVGYSMGGPVAELVWRRHPAVVDGLVLCATAATFGGWRGDRALFTGMLGLSALVRVAPPTLRRRVLASVVQPRLRGPLGEWAYSEIERNDPAAVLQAGSAIGTYDARPWIGDVDVPTAVLVTTQDTLVNPLRQVALAESIPGSHRFDVAGDHGVCVTDPKRFVPVLVEAARAVAARAALTPSR